MGRVSSQAKRSSRDNPIRLKTGSRSSWRVLGSGEFELDLAPTCGLNVKGEELGGGEGLERVSHGMEELSSEKKEE